MLNPSRRPLVLCVDDEPELLRGMTLHLARHYEVRTADSGAEGLELLRNEPHAAAIISDMRMPGMSGADFLARSLAIAPDAQRILLTGNVDLTSAIAAVNEGQIFRFLMKPCPPPDLLQAVQDAVTRFQSRDLERTAARRRVEHHQLQTDPLTGLGSRQKLMATLEAAAYDSAGDAWQRAVLFVDIDSSDEPLKDHDQPWGDEVARLIADRLRQCASPGAEMTRWGPDQFVVLVKSAACTDDELLRRAANKVNALTAPIPVDRYHVNIGASIGVARLRDRLEWQKLVQQGATAAREARGAGPGSVRLFRGDVPAAADQQRALLHELRKALRDGGLQVHYQPIVDVRKGRVHSLEALVRWNHPILGSIPPSTFIPLIETTGDIVDLGRWVLQAACVEAAELVREERIGLSVNVSPRQVLDSTFLPHLGDCLSKSGMASEALEIELTETALASDVDRLCDVLERVRALKVRVAVDDFGTGYSSLAYLNRLPLDTIKVDRTFVNDLQRGGRTIIKAAGDVAREFGRAVIVEGVETAEMLREIRELGIVLVQGYYFARPMPLPEVRTWLRNFEQRDPE